MSRKTRVLRLFAGAAGVVMFIAQSAASQDAVTLNDGDRLTGTVVERSDESVTLEHRFGTLIIPVAEIDSLTIGDEQVIVSDADAEAPGDEEAADTPTGEWKGHVEIAGSGYFGNTDTQGGHVAVTLVRESLRDRTALDASYYYGASGGDRTTNKFTAGVRQDWFVPESPWFFFAQGRYEYDEFQSWEHRVTTHGGVGYHLIDTERFDLKLRGGLGVAKEWNVDATRFEALAGADIAWQITDRQHFELSTTLYPDLLETGEYRWITTAAWSLRFENSSNLSITAGLRNEYQTDVEPGVKHNDLYVYTGLMFDF